MTSRNVWTVAIETMKIARSSGEQYSKRACEDAAKREEARFTWMPGVMPVKMPVRDPERKLMIDWII